MPYCASTAADSRLLVAPGEDGAVAAAQSEQRAEDAVGPVLHVGGVGVAARRVLELVGQAGRRDLQVDRAAVERGALAVGRLDPLLAADDLAGARVDVAEQPAGSAVRVASRRGELPREPRRGADGVDHEAWRALDADVADRPGHPVPDGDDPLGPGLAERRPDRDPHRSGEGLAHAVPDGVRALVDHEVTADDRQPSVGPLHPHVGAAVGVADRRRGAELLAGRRACDEGVCLQRGDGLLGDAVAARLGGGGRRAGGAGRKAEDESGQRSGRGGGRCQVRPGSGPEVRHGSAPWGSPWVRRMRARER